MDKTVVHICKGCDITDSHLGEWLFLNQFFGCLDETLFTLGSRDG
jgi:hypothetical protein